LYSLLFSIYVAVGLTTTPIETAAGAAFGFRDGALASGFGKWLGAVLAFSLARTRIDVIRKWLDESHAVPMLDAVSEAVEKDPFKVALLWRISFLPELVKNFSLAIMPMPLLQFMAAVFCHGFPYSVLWSKVGSAAFEGGKASEALRVTLFCSAIFGLGVSPVLVALWLKSLSKEVSLSNRREKRRVEVMDMDMDMGENEMEMDDNERFEMK
jgi:uncharacterized membrane protein YdjX (TVP38/TMEM64 family)